MKTILYTEFANTAGGSQVILHSILQNIDKTKYRPVVVYNSCNVEPCTLQTDIIPNVIYHPIKFWLPWVHTKTFNWFYKHISKSLAVLCRQLYWGIAIVVVDLFRFGCILAKYKPDIVHSNNACTHNLAIPILCKILRIPFISHLRDRCAYPFGDLFKLAHKFPICEISVSHHIKETCKDILSDYKNRVHVIWDGIQGDDFASCVNYEYLKDEFSIKDGQKIFGFIGRVISWKGIEEFINAATYVLKIYPEAIGFIVGGYEQKDPYYLMLKKMIVDAGISNNIIFTGYRQDIPYFVNMFDVVIHCSVIPEPLGTTIMEAMACSKPMVAYNAGGASEEIVNNKTGILVPMKDSISLGKGIVQVLNNSNLINIFSVNGRKRYEKYFTGSVSCKQIEAIYETII